MHSFSVVGSCVSRDAIEFIDNIECPMYIARSSLVSIFSKAPIEEEIKKLEIQSEIHRFHRDCIVDDIFKNSITKIANSDNEYIIIDLIEERVPLGIFESGSIVTLSQASRLYSNLESLVSKKILPFTEEYMNLFIQMIDQIDILNNSKIIIHKALYAESMERNNENEKLNFMYEVLHQNLKKSIMIEPDSRYVNATHKWGVAPYHYIDEYYKSFVSKLSLAINQPISLKNLHTLNKE